MSIVYPTCPLDFHHPPSVILVPLSPLHKGTIVSVLSPLLFRALHMTCLRVVLGNHQQHSLTFSLPLSRHHVAKVIRYTRPPEGAPQPLWMSENHEVWFRDPLQVLENQIANPDFKGLMDLSPKWVYHKGKHQYNDLMSGNWAWEQAVSY